MLKAIILSMLIAPASSHILTNPSLVNRLHLLSGQRLPKDVPTVDVRLVSAACCRPLEPQQGVGLSCSGLSELVRVQVRSALLKEHGIGALGEQASQVTAVDLVTV